MKATIIHLPKNSNPWRGWMTIELENGISCGIRNDYIKIPHDELRIGMIVEVSFKTDGNISEVNFPNE